MSTRAESLDAEPLVLREDADGVATLTMNRPERLNALSTAMRVELHDAVTACAADGDVRVIVITVAGRGFCSGVDVKAMNNVDRVMLAGKWVGGEDQSGQSPGEASRESHAVSLQD